MHDPNLNLLRADERRVLDRYHERLKEAEARRLENLALGHHRAPPLAVRLAARLLQALRGLLPGLRHLTRGRRRPPLGADQAVKEP